MKRLLGPGIVAVMTTMAVAAFGPSCTDYKSGVFIAGIQAPPQVAAGARCTFLPDPNAAQLSSGTLDVGLTETYAATVLVGSQLQGRVSPELLRTETARAVLEGFSVRIVDSGGKERAAFTRLGSLSISSAAGSATAYGVSTDVTLIDPTTARALRDEIIATKTGKRVLVYVKTFGRTLGGNSFESTEFALPIDVCVGCLLNFPAAANDPATNFACGGRFNCNLPSATVPSTCRLGQDEFVDCRACVGRNILCDPLGGDTCANNAVRDGGRD